MLSSVQFNWSELGKILRYHTFKLENSYLHRKASDLNTLHLSYPLLLQRLDLWAVYYHYWRRVMSKIDMITRYAQIRIKKSYFATSLLWSVRVLIRYPIIKCQCIVWRGKNYTCGGCYSIECLSSSSLYQDIIAIFLFIQIQRCYNSSIVR